MDPAIHQCLIGVPNQVYKQCFQKRIDRLKMSIQADGLHFEGQSKFELSKHLLVRKTNASDIIFRTPLVHVHHGKYEHVTHSCNCQDSSEGNF